MKQLKFLVILMLVTLVGNAQAPSNYTNINGRYRWIAGMFDSTFHIPKGATPSLRTGGSTNSGGLFYNTSDSSVYTYTGTQWIKLRGSLNPSDTTNKYVTQVYKKNGSDSVFYVKGGTHTWAFNDSTGSAGGGGGGKIYYFNGSVNMGTFGGLTMYELGDTANTGAAANFTRSTTGAIANFITDPNKPGLLQIPAGVWTIDAWLSETGGGANHAEIWAVLEKWNGSTITTIATSPIEEITEGSSPNLYTWAITVPTTTLAVTDRVIIQFYITNTNGKTVTLYTQNGYVGEVHTTFTTGIGAINGLTAPAQYLTTGTSGTDFNISSVTATHTFNLPTASATNRGALSTTDWTTFNNKIGGSLVNGYLTKATGANTIDTSQLFQSSGLIGIGTTSPTQKLQVSGNAYVNGQFFAGDTALSVYQVEGILNTPYVLGRKAVDNTLSTEARPTGVLGHVVGRGSIANRLQGGAFYATTDSNSTANSTGSLRGATAWSSHNGSGSLATAWGGYNIVTNKTTGTITNAYGSVSGVENRGATSTINKLQGSTTEVWNNYGGTIDTAWGQVISIYNNNAASNIGAVYGLSIGRGLITPTGGTHFWRNLGTIGSSYGIYLDSAIDVGTNRYAIYSNSYSNSYLRANLGLGTSTPDSNLTVANGAYFQRGVRMSALPSAPGTKAVRINANGTLSVADTLTNGVSGSLTTDFIPKATGTSTLGNSPLSVGAGVVGLGLGVVPPNAWTNYWALQLANGVALGSYNFSNIPIGWLGTNAYHDGMGDIRVSNGAANKYLQDRGNHKWYVAGSGTAGSYISFTQAMTLDSSNRLSIGTTTMDSMFKVAQGAYFQRGVRMSGLPTGAGTKAVRIDANGTLSTADTLANGISGTGTTNYIPKFTSSSAIGNSVMQEVSSDIGIGMIPVSGYKLNVNGLQRNEGANTVLNFGELDANNIYFQALNNAGNASKGFVWFGTAERMRLDASGNLGLGVTPSAWARKAIQIGDAAQGYVVSNTRTGFAVNMYYDGNNKYIENNYAALYAQDGTSGQHQWYIAPSGTAGNAITFTQAMTLVGTSDVKLSIGTTANDGNANYGNITLNGLSGSLIDVRQNGTLYGRVRAQANEFALLSQGASSVLVLGTDNTERARFNTSGELLINTTTDVGDYKLQVSGNVYASGSGTFGSTMLISNTTNAYAYQNFGATSGYGWQIGKADNSGALAPSNGFYIYDLTNSATRMVISQSGNVGIGTTSPAYKLEVQNGTAGADIRVSNTGGGYAQLSISSNATSVAQLSYSNQLSLIGGNVGIGTSSPNLAGATVGLSVNSSNYSVFELNQNNARAFYIYSNSGESYVGTFGAAPLVFRTNDTERMRITSGGNVGIGTTSPTVKLDVIDSGTPPTASAGTSARFVSAGGSGFDALIGIVGGNGGRSMIDFGDTDAVSIGRLGYDHTANFMFMQTNGGERMRITSGGELLINTTTDVGDYHLQVNGNIYSTGDQRLEGALYLTNGGGGTAQIYGSSTDGVLRIRNNNIYVPVIKLMKSDGTSMMNIDDGNTTITGSIKTAAPSGGTAKPWKLGEAGVTVGGANNTAVKVEIDGVVYYLLTAYLPEPAPEAAPKPKPEN